MATEIAKRKRNSKRAPAKSSQHQACAALIAMKPEVFDRDLVESVVGDQAVDSMPMVAKAFQVSATTIRQSWKANGMPGSRGHYKLAEIALWKLEHDKKNEKYTSPVSRHSERMKEIEEEKAELDLKARKQKYMEGHGQLVSRDEVRAEVYAMLTVFRENLLAIPRALMPMLPAKIAESVASEVDKLIRHALEALKGKAERAYPKQERGQE